MLIIILNTPRVLLMKTEWTFDSDVTITLRILKFKLLCEHA